MRWIQAIIVWSIVFTGGVSLAQPIEGPAEPHAAATAQSASRPLLSPLPASSPLRSPRHRSGTDVDIRTAWNLGRPEAAPRGTACTFDNGAPLDDFNDPASQLSQSMTPGWNFIAASADDFMLGSPGDPDLCRITLIRAAFLVADDGSGNPTPTNTWHSIIVTVYSNDTSMPPDKPSAFPDINGGQTGPFIVSQEVPVASLLNETLTGECRPCYVIDIPVNFLLHKGVKYWLSLVPRHDGAINSTQSFWCLSETPASTDDDAVQYFPPFFTDWAAIPGNSDDCATELGAGAYRNLAFSILTADTQPAVTGACCDDTTGGPMGTCSDNESIVHCQKPNDRFGPNATCVTLNPECGVQDPGACCSGAGVCLDTLTPFECYVAGGQWYVGSCPSFICPPVNIDCDQQIPLNGSHVVQAFNTGSVMAGAGDPLTNCGAILQGIWFSYEAACDGTVTISTLGSSFDTVLAVYGPATGCPVSCPLPSPDGDYTEAACSDDIIGGTDSYIVMPVTAGQCLLIRVGGKNGASPTGGEGVLNIDCIPFGSGACCHADLSCDTLDESQCILPGDLFTPGQPCNTAVTCPPACCLGDMDNNCVVDTEDLPLFVEYLLDPGSAGAEAFCRADVNRDLAINALDVQPIIRRILDGATCLVDCCPGDFTGDGLLDGLDLQGMINALLTPPPCSTIDFCHADVNEDLLIDLTDAEALVDRLLAGDTCPVP